MTTRHEDPDGTNGVPVKFRLLQCRLEPVDTLREGYPPSMKQNYTKSSMVSCDHHDAS